MNVLKVCLTSGLLALGGWLASDARAAEKLPAELRQEAVTSIRRASEFLRSSQNADGSFADGDHAAAITALVLTGLLNGGEVTPADPMVAKGLTYLEKFIQPDGGIYPTGGMKTYPTSIAVLAFSAANKDGRYKEVLDRAVAFLKTDQWDEEEGVTKDQVKYGGAGYGKKSRPDLSNTAFLLEALEAAKLPKDDPAYQRAALFVSRCQNYAGEGGNDLPQAKLINDGGFYYTPAEDYNPGGGTQQQGLRSYGSMTYAGLKSFIHAGVGKDDPRVQAALGWIRKHYTVKENPGMQDQGLYYYYHTFAKALAVLDLETLKDAEGTSHDWRSDLVRELVHRQKADGSWANTNGRWLENDPRLVTAYALMALGRVVN